MGAVLLAALASPAFANDCHGPQSASFECRPGTDAERCARKIEKVARDCVERRRELQAQPDGPSKQNALKIVDQTLDGSNRWAQSRPDVQKLLAGGWKEPGEDAPVDDKGKGGAGRQGRTTPAVGGGFIGGGSAPEAPRGSDPAAKAEEALKTGDYETAEQAATEAIAQAPKDPAAWLARAQARSLKGNPEGAREDARQALALDPSPEQGRAALGLIGNADALKGAADKIKGRKLEFASKPADGGLGGGRSQQAAKPGRAPADPKRAAAEAAALPAAQGGPRNEAADRAYAKLRMHDFSGAREEADKALAERPHDARARALRAAAFNRLGRYDEAIQDCDAALKQNPADVSALLERGYARYQLGRYVEALGDVDAALGIDPYNAMGYLYRGMILEKLSRVSEALAAYLKAGELDPGLQPVVDEHVARLKGGGAKPRAASRGALSSILARWKLWLAVIVAALLLLGRGLRRAIKPEWATPMTPRTPTPLVLLAVLLAASVCARADTGCEQDERWNTMQICDPNTPKYNSRRCENRITDQARTCKNKRGEKEKELEQARRRHDQEDVDRLTKTLADIDRLTSSIPTYQQTAREHPSAPETGDGKRKSGQGQGADGGLGGGLGGGQPGQGGAPQSPQLTAAQNAIKQGDYDSAEQAATQAIEQNPQDPDAWLARAQARSLKGDREGARADAKKVLGLDPKPQQGMIAQSLVGNAEQLAQAAAKISGQRPKFANRPTDSGAGSGKPGDVGRRGPGARELASAAGGAYGAAEGGGVAPAAGGGAQMDPKQAAALAAALPAAQGGPKNEAADRAYFKLRVHDFSGAYDEASKALAERPGDARARTIRAAAANRLGLYEQAVADADAALAAKPKDVTALLERGYAKYKLGKYTDALEDVDMALIEDPLNAMGYLYRGMILEKLSRAADAVSAYIKAGELDPGLKPVVDEAQARLGGKPKAAPVSGVQALTAYALSRWKLWLVVLAAAGLLLARGFKRAVKPEWATPVTPLR